MYRAVNVIEPITGKHYRKLVNNDFIMSLPIDNSFIKNWTNKYKSHLNVRVYSDGYDRRDVFIFYRHYEVYNMNYNYTEQHHLDDRMIEEHCWDDVERHVVSNIMFKVHELDNTELITKISDLKEDSKRDQIMISLYIPNDKSVDDVIRQLIDEHESAKNISNESDRYYIQCAIEDILYKLEYLQMIPENGIAYFGGSIAKWFVPPKPIMKYQYCIDSVYNVSILEEMID